MKKRIVSIALAITMLFSLAAPALAEGTQNNHYTFIVAGVEYEHTIQYDPDQTEYNAAHVVGLADKTLTDVVISSYVDTYEGVSCRVTNINQRAFQNETGIVSVRIPDNVSIGEYAFSGCGNLKLVRLESPMPPFEGYYVFNGISADAVIEVPMGRIGLTPNGKYEPYDMSTMYGCGALVERSVSGQESIGDRFYKNMGNSLIYKITSLSPTRTVEASPFENVDGENSSYTIPEAVTAPYGATYNVESIGGFTEKNISSITLPSSIKKISDYAFRESTVTNINLPEGLETIGKEAYITGPSDLTIPSTCSFHTGSKMLSPPI